MNMLFPSLDLLLQSLEPFNPLLLPLIQYEESLQQSKEVFDNIDINVEIRPKDFIYQDDIVEVNIGTIFLAFAERCDDSETRKTFLLLNEKYKEEFGLINISDIESD